jgi:hypothetical protein
MTTNPHAPAAHHPASGHPGPQQGAPPIPVSWRESLPALEARLEKLELRLAALETKTGGPPPPPPAPFGPPPTPPPNLDAPKEAK